MIKNDLLKYKNMTGYNLSQVEIDYMQNILLNVLYRKYDKIYFKGGTCLQKCYGLRRFSEDLDFNYDTLSLQNLISYLNTHFPYEFEIKDINETVFGFSLKLSIKGILYDGTRSTTCRISLDFRKGDTYINKKLIKIKPLFQDIVEYSVIALSEEEILAEKIRAIITRNKARDLFDVYTLLKKKTTINKKLINLKLKSYDLVYSNKILKKSIDSKKRIYDTEISNLVKEYPSFEECKQMISLKFRL